VPVYDYTCATCGQLTEVIHPIHDGAPRFCPACGAEGAMRKGFATPAVHFKGSGWAKKDRAASSAGKSRAAKPAGDSGAGDSGASQSGAGDSGKSDSGKGDSGKGDSGKSDEASSGATKSAAATTSDGGE
jgi:putative FmdB family regulatory protein